MWNAASRQFFLNQAKVYPYATGGDYVYLYEEDGKTYRVHEFLSTGTSTLQVEVGGQMDVLVVGGGGGGNNMSTGGGGGGGGGFSTRENVNISEGNYSIFVGAGAPGNNNNNITSNHGQTSSFQIDQSDIVESGGGKSAPRSNNTSHGGNSGLPQNNLGGDHAGGPSYGGGGGGGAGGEGVDSDPNVNAGAAGGTGQQWLNLKYYGGGGGGGAGFSNGIGGAGGLGGGGSGTPRSTPGISGSANTGGGGGGSRGAMPGSGGSGIVIVRYVIAEKKLWTPSELSSLKAWYDASDESTVTVTSSRVSQLDDKSGNSLNLTKGTTGPTYTTNGLNGLPVMTFGGTEWLNAATASDWNFLHNTSGSTVVAVWKPGTSSNPNAVYALMGTNAGTNVNVGCSLSYENRSIITGADNAIIANVSNGNGSTRVLAGFNFDAGNTIFSDFNSKAVGGTASVNAWVIDPNNGTAANRLKVNRNGGSLGGNQTFTGTPSTSNAAFALQVGAIGNNVIPLTGYIAEVVIANSKLSTADRQRLEGYLAHKWGLTNNLPAGHPYKYEPPYKVEPEEIVTDGLVLNLDAGDYASYPRSGTTWYDLSGGGNNGTLTNGPTYDSANKGSIVFDGANDYITIPQETGEFSNSSMTVEFWIKPHTIAVGGNVITMDRTTFDGNTGIEIFFLGGQNGIISVRGSGATRIDSTGTATLNEWNFVSVVYSGTTAYIYINGVFDSSGSVQSVNTTNYDFHIGIFPTLGYYYDGNIATFSIYNRALSSTEITQNFNALRGRYGI